MAVMCTHSSLDGLTPRKFEMEQPMTSTADNVNRQPFAIGVASGVAARKSTICDMIIEQLHDQRVVLV
ncbi:Uridine kinase-like protein 4 [Acorus calamus]|uniref:Uridine kinase-like protein 4 n=1 Tax=Acorus calamus TaxID=4465 RepID=A0AAV9D5I3_ACOCL|nr:Uridine kinase-like protein 4 [Acorus calamus]